MLFAQSLYVAIVLIALPTIIEQYGFYIMDFTAISIIFTKDGQRNKN